VIAGRSRPVTVKPRRRAFLPTISIFPFFPEATISMSPLKIWRSSLCSILTVLPLSSRVDFSFPESFHSSGSDKSGLLTSWASFTRCMSSVLSTIVLLRRPYLSSFPFLYPCSSSPTGGSPLSLASRHSAMPPPPHATFVVFFFSNRRRTVPFFLPLSHQVF